MKNPYDYGQHPLKVLPPASIQFSGIHFFEQTVMMELHLHGGGGFDRRVINEGKRQFEGHKEGTGGWF